MLFDGVGADRLRMEIQDLQIVSGFVHHAKILMRGAVPQIFRRDRVLHRRQHRGVAVIRHHDAHRHHRHRKPVGRNRLEGDRTVSLFRRLPIQVQKPVPRYPVVQPLRQLPGPDDLGRLAVGQDHPGFQLLLVRHRDLPQDVRPHRQAPPAFDRLRLVHVPFPGIRVLLRGDDRKGHVGFHGLLQGIMHVDTVPEPGFLLHVPEGLPHGLPLEQMLEKSGLFFARAVAGVRFRIPEHHRNAPPQQRRAEQIVFHPHAAVQHHQAVGRGVRHVVDDHRAVDHPVP